MQKINGQIILSPTDLNKFIFCDHLITYELRKLEGENFDLPDEEITLNDLVAQRGNQHEENYLNYLVENDFEVLQIDTEQNLIEKIDKTIEGINNHVDIIYQGVLKGSRWLGVFDFLKKKQNNNYYVIDTKLKKVLTSSYISQVVIYSFLIEEIFGYLPDIGSIISPSDNQENLFVNHDFQIDNYKSYVKLQMQSFENFIDNMPNTRPIPCSHCDRCKFKSLCKVEWQQNLSIFELPFATRLQEKRLSEVNINNINDLIESDQKPNKMAVETFKKLKLRANLRGPRLQGGPPRYKVLGDDGLKFMPKQDEHDIYFDIEGDPLIDDGLEYLFGLLKKNEEGTNFRDLWAHSKTEEKEQVRNLINIFYKHCLTFPNAHIYHYNAYEVNALRRLSQEHNVEEKKLDELLRAERFIDIYTVVQMTLLTSEKGLSLKDLEVFYNFVREEEVTNAGASVVMYEKWLETFDDNLLEQIKLYNKQDCISLLELRNWLDTLIENFNNFRITKPLKEDIPEEEIEEMSVDQEIAVSLASYHKRETKPYWWSFFDCKTRSVDDLLNDSSVLAGLHLINIENDADDITEKKYSFQEQDHKFSSGDQVTFIIPNSLDPNFGLSGKIKNISDDNNTITLSSKKGLFTDLHLKESLPPRTNNIENVLQSFLELVHKGDANLRTPAAYGLINKPLTNHNPTFDWVDRIINHPNLNNSDFPIFVQGPPGSGKTFQGATFLKDLVEKKDGKICFITSQSHKAIENILISFSKSNPESSQHAIKFGGNEINDEIEFIKSDYRRLKEKIFDAKEKKEFLFLGLTVFAITNLINHIDGSYEELSDYLIIDEAGQYGIANAVAASIFTKNVILLGDQNQLPNVVQGSHPMNVGASVMEFWLGNDSIVDDTQGMFLPITRRLHPKICNYISNSFYQSQLEAHQDNLNRKVLYKVDGVCKDISGINLLEIEHEGCLQSSEEEQLLIKDKIFDLLDKGLICQNDLIRPIKPSDIIVLAPYNSQVNGLLEILSNEIKVGTVDKFQGQEAPICIISMTSSSVEEAPRGINFLLNSNRMNVAISRAQSSVFIYASRKLFFAEAKTTKQMKLLNDFCKLKNFTN